MGRLFVINTCYLDPIDTRWNLSFYYSAFQKQKLCECSESGLHTVIRNQTVPCNRCSTVLVSGFSFIFILLWNMIFNKDMKSSVLLRNVNRCLRCQQFNIPPLIKTQKFLISLMVSTLYPKTLWSAGDSETKVILLVWRDSSSLIQFVKGTEV